MATVTVGESPFAIAFNDNNQNMYVTNIGSGTVSVIDQNNDVVDTVTVGDFPFAIAYNPGNEHLYVVNEVSDTVSVIGMITSSFEGILVSGNNINIQVQENAGNNVGGQSGFGGSYSDSPIHQGQSTNQDSSVVS